MSKSSDKCFLSLLCCTQKKKAQASDPRRILLPTEQEIPHVQMNQVASARQIHIDQNSSSSNPSRSESSRSENPQIQEMKTNIEILKFKSLPVEFVDALPEDVGKRKQFKYNCPICLRYFNHVFESQCCKNYLCHLCTEGLQIQEQKQRVKAVCPFGCTTEGQIFFLQDVNEHAPVKKYSDSQMMNSCHSGFMQQRSLILSANKTGFGDKVREQVNEQIMSLQKNNENKQANDLRNISDNRISRPASKVSRASSYQLELRPYDHHQPEYDESSQIFQQRSAQLPPTQRIVQGTGFRPSSRIPLSPLPNNIELKSHSSLMNTEEQDSLLKGMMAQIKDVARVLSPELSAIDKVNEFHQKGFTLNSGFELSPLQNQQNGFLGSYEENPRRFQTGQYNMVKQFGNIIEEDQASLHDDDSLSRA